MEERRKHNKLFWIFLILFLAAIGCIAFITVRNHLQNIKDRELREKVETSVTEEPEVSAEEEPVQIPVDFATLQAEIRISMHGFELRIHRSIIRSSRKREMMIIICTVP